jgi:hypothetical protein
MQANDFLCSAGTMCAWKLLAAKCNGVLLPCFGETKLNSALHSARVDPYSAPCHRIGIQIQKNRYTVEGVNLGSVVERCHSALRESYNITHFGSCQ